MRRISAAPWANSRRSPGRCPAHWVVEAAPPRHANRRDEWSALSFIAWGGGQPLLRWCDCDGGPPPREDRAASLRVEDVEALEQVQAHDRVGETVGRAAMLGIGCRGRTGLLVQHAGPVAVVESF